MTNKDEKKIRFGGWNKPPYKFVRRKLLRIAFEEDLQTYGIIKTCHSRKETREQMNLEGNITGTTENNTSHEIMF